MAYTHSVLVYVRYCSKGLHAIIKFVFITPIVMDSFLQEIETKRGKIIISLMG